MDNNALTWLNKIDQPRHGVAETESTCGNSSKRPEGVYSYKLDESNNYSLDCVN